jgi:hypothetical protein
VVLRAGLAEGQRVLDPPFVLSPDLEALLASPLASRPGVPPDGRRYLHLPFRWGDHPHMGQALDHRVARPLVERQRFFLVADPGTAQAFDDWLRWRFDGAFQVTYASRVFIEGGVVLRYERRQGAERRR